MMAAPVAVGGAVELLERAVGYALGSLHEVTPESMAGPTPCAGWTLHRLMAHLDDGLQALYGALDEGAVDVEPIVQETCPVAVLQARASGLLGALSAPGGREAVRIGGCELTTALVAGCGALELAVHGWDIARACGVRHPLPHALATDLLELAPLLVTPHDRPARFATPVPVPTTATPGDKLVAWLGRTP